VETEVQHTNGRESTLLLPLKTKQPNSDHTNGELLCVPAVLSTCLTLITTASNHCFAVQYTLDALIPHNIAVRWKILS